MKSVFKLFLLFFLSFQAIGQERATDFAYSTPTAEKVDAQGILSFIEAVKGSEHELHSLMVLRRGKVIAEGWWNPYGPDLKHTMYSVSKTYTASGIGFAVSEGLISVEDQVIKFFPESLPTEVSENLKDLKIKHLLTMSVGHARDYTFSVVRTEDWVRSFLAVPIVNEPGSQFLYNTVATYMLSAIIQKVTGQTLFDYLSPRLFQPLGITGADWETSPNGINTGGYGLRVKTVDMAKLGQLFLQNGTWKGQEILPKSWINEARSLKILQNPDASEEETAKSDWIQGYAYQLWRSRHASYRADGAYGQYILVLPEQEAVIAITSKTSNLQGLLDEVWEHILPAFDHASSSQKDKELQFKLEMLSHSPSIGVENRAMENLLSGKNIALGENEEKINFHLDFKSDELMLNVIDGQKKYSLTIGHEQWVPGSTERKQPYLVAQAKNALSGLAPFKIFSSYYWDDFQTLVVDIKYIESPHTETLRLAFDGEKVSLETTGIRKSTTNGTIDGSLND